MSSDNVGVPDSQSYVTDSRGDAQREAKCSKTTLEQYKKMNLNPDGDFNQRLAIMCKMGPSTEDVEVLQQMIEAGMTIAMIEMFEYSDHDKVRETVRKIREANDRVSSNLKMMYPLAIAMRIKGAEVYTGLNEDGPDSVIELQTGNEVMLTLDPEYKDKSNKDMIYIDYPKVTNGLDMKPRHRVLLNRGEVKLKITEVDIGTYQAKCYVVKGGALRSRATVDIPDSLAVVPTVTEEDLEDIKLAAELRLDIVILRFTQCAEDIHSVRTILSGLGSRIMICACIMDHQGFQKVDEIIKAADSVQIVRGHMAANPVSWNFLLASRSIISKCRSVGKPSIVTCRITSGYDDDENALLTDVANAAQVVLEGADCFGLGNEVAKGSRPVQRIRYFVTICKEVNKLMCKEDLLEDIGPPMLYNGLDFESVYITAVRLSLSINAVAIIVLTTTGQSAYRISKLQPLCPIIAITGAGYVSRQMRLYRCVHPLYYILRRRSNWIEDLDARIQFGVIYGKRRGFIKPGDPILAIHGFEKGVGNTNTIRLMFASSRDVV